MYSFLSKSKQWVECISRQLALTGGLIMILLALITVISIIGRSLFGTSIEGDYELVEVGLAISIFLFLTECQVKKGHVIVDFFTVTLAKRKIYFLDAVGNLLFTLIGGLITWQLSQGGLESYEYLEQSMILEIPIWIAYVPAVISTGLLTICCLIDTLLGYREFLTS